MAWSLISTLATGTEFPNPACDGSDKIFYSNLVSSFPEVYQWSRAGGVATRISIRGTSFPNTGTFAGNLQWYPTLVYFDGGLYCTVTDTTGFAKIYKYDGTGTSWTLVYTVTIANAGTILVTDGTTLVALSHVTATQTTDVRYTTDGASWSAGTFTLNPTPPAGTYISAVSYTNTNISELGIFVRYQQIRSGGVGFGFAEHIMGFSAGAFTTQDYYDFDGTATYRGNSWVTSWLQASSGHWRTSPGIDYSQDLLSWTTPTTTTVLPIWTLGFIKKSGGYDGTTNQVLYTINTVKGDSDWAESQTVRTGAGIMKAIVRFTSDGIPFVFTGSGFGGSAQYYLYQSDTPIADGQEIKFYQGTNTLSLKSVIPISAINGPDSMDRTSTDIWMANSGSDAIKLVTAGAGDDWASWTDKTGSIADPVNAIKIINKVVT